MKDYKELSRVMERTIHKYMQMEKKPREFAPGVVLTHAEIHTIAIVGDHPNINVTELAKLRGVTKGAASQMIYKLVDKGYVEKKVSPTSDTEVCLSLTGSGKKAYDAHREKHEKSGYQVLSLLGEMPEETQEYFYKMLNAYEKYIDEHLEK